VLEAVAPMGAFALADPRAEETARDRLAPRERQVLDAVPLVQGADASSIARTAGLAQGKTKEALLVLHRSGLVEHSLGRWRLADAAAPPA
jgi:DNA processing protein